MVLGEIAIVVSSVDYRQTVAVPIVVVLSVAVAVDFTLLHDIRAETTSPICESKKVTLESRGTWKKEKK